AFLSVDIEYRTTELIMKYGADLVFFHEVLIPEILEGNPWGITTPSVVRCYFPSCYISLLYLPVLYRFTDPVQFLEDVQANEPETYSARALYRSRSIMGKDPSVYGYRSRRKMTEMAQELMEQGVIDRPRLEAYLRGLDR